MRQVKGTPKFVGDKIGEYFKKNIKGLTKVDDIISREDFVDKVDEEGESAVGGTATTSIAVHATPLGVPKKKKKNVKTQRIQKRSL